MAIEKAINKKVSNYPTIHKSGDWFIIDEGKKNEVKLFDEKHAYSLFTARVRLKLKKASLKKRIKLKKYSDLVDTHKGGFSGEGREDITDDERYGLGESPDYSEN